MKLLIQTSYCLFKLTRIANWLKYWSQFEQLKHLGFDSYFVCHSDSNVNLFVTRLAVSQKKKYIRKKFKYALHLHDRFLKTTFPDFVIFSPVFPLRRVKPTTCFRTAAYAASDSTHSKESQFCSQQWMAMSSSGFRTRDLLMNESFH